MTYKKYKRGGYSRPDRRAVGNASKDKIKSSYTSFLTKMGFVPSAKELADITGLSRSWIRKKAKEESLDLRDTRGRPPQNKQHPEKAPTTRGRPRKVTNSDFIAAYDKCKADNGYVTASLLAKTVGLHQTTVNGRLRELDLPTVGAQPYKYVSQVAWIADNDDPSADDALDDEAVRILTTVVMVADTWGKTPLDVAKDVIRVRRARS